ncbi:MAG TPA: phage tail tube protein [Solirubrobacterales bacterium]
MTTQLDCSIGLAAESTYGTGVTPTRFLEFLSEGLDANIEFSQGEGMRVGSRVPRADRRDIAKFAPGGPIELEACTSGLGLLLNAAFGAQTNTLVPTSTAYQQVHTPTNTDPLNSYTIQKGIPPVGGGATLAHTFVGAVCDSIEFSADAGDIVKIVTEWLAKDILTATAYAAPSYPANLRLFTFVHGGIFINNGTLTVPTTTALGSITGSALANINKFSVKWSNNLDTQGFNLGGAGKRSRKNVVGAGSVEGSVTAEFSDATLRDAYLANSNLSMVLTFTRPEVINASVYPVLQIIIPAVRLEGELPKSNAGGVITQSINFTGLDNLTNAPIYVVYRTADTAL